MFVYFINGNNVYNEYDVVIYKDNKILYQGKTKNNKLKYNFKRNNLYIIKITNLRYGIYRHIPYYCKNKNEVNYYNIQIPYVVKIKLKDRYYPNMPIEKGNILLWMNM